MLIALATISSLTMAPALADPAGQWQDDNGPAAGGPDAPHGQPGKHERDAQHGNDRHDNAQYQGRPDGGHRSPAGPGVDYKDARHLAMRYRLTGRPPLPPGMAKNLARGRRLPPGIERRPVPPDMLRNLPAAPGREWRMVGGDLVQIVVSTAVVTAVIQGVFN